MCFGVTVLLSPVIIVFLSDYVLRWLCHPEVSRFDSLVYLLIHLP